MLEIFLTIIWFPYLILRCKKSLHMLQQNLYDDDFRYVKWLKKNFSKVMLSFDLVQLFLIFFILFVKNGIVIPIMFSIVYILLFIYTFGKSYREVIKKPLVITSRIKRLITTIVILFVLFIYIGYISDINYYIVLSLLGYMIYFISLIAVKINIPIEKCVYLSYKRKAIKKLNSLSNLDVIGITGSYGKTSSKNILNDVLNCKYNCIATPRNLNTPYGLIMTINNDIDKFDELFIAEMGAYKMGEIKELCDLVHPKYGILTKIGKAHLELFGSEENIQKGKFELIESLPNDGVAILNKDDKMQVNYELKNDVKVLWIGIDNECDYRAINISVTSSGTSFDLVVKGDKKKYRFETKLLGYANIYNILSSIALGNYLGIKIKQLQNAVKSVKPVEHRLEIKGSNGLYYIDDAYNSNPEGAKMALDVLNLMPGKKIIVTPGMVELGKDESLENTLFGEEIALVCDEVILIGKEQTKDIQKGLENKNYNKEHIHILEEVKDAFTLINKFKDKEMYVLLENDLPDLFK